MRSRGFTLIELLVTMSIAAILAALAFPTYRNAMHRAQRLEARMALQRIQYLQERHYAEFLRYAARFGNAGTEELAAADRSESGSYVLSLTTGEDGQSFLVTAQARAGGRQADDHACQQLAVDETGQRRSADASGNWSTTDPQRCWG
jgi:type IV pilus assembly protein PilE